MIRHFVLALLLLAALRPAFAATEIQRVVSPGGIEAWLIETHDNPLFALSFAIPGGAAADPDGKAGLTRWLAATLDEGAGALDSVAFRAELEERSIDLSFSADQDSIGGRLQALTRERDRAFELLRLALTEPRFDAEAIERVRGQLLSVQQRKAQDPEAIAGQAMAAAIFRQHPYGRPLEGTAESLAALTVDDLRAVAAERLQRHGLTIGVVGDITAAELAPLLDSTFGALPFTAPPPAAASYELSAPGQTLVQPFPGAQSTILVAQPGLRRDDPDYYAARVVDHILGGGAFDSRLFVEVREKRGLAYGAWSSLATDEAGGVWYAGTSTQNARAAETLEILRQEWAKMAAEGPSDAEIARAIDYLTGSFVQQLTSSAGIADLLVSLQRQELGIDYIDRRESLYRALTPEQVRSVAKQRLDPALLTVVVVGEPVGLQPTAR